MPRPQLPVILTDKKQLSDNTIELDFQFEGNGTFEYVAGQFIQLLFQHNGEVHKRSYSIASSPESFQQTKTLSIAISFVENGLASSYFRDAQPGGQLQLMGPFGVLVLPEQIPGQLILIGTGTGIAPYRAMTPQLEALAKQGQSITILMGARTRQELIYQEDFRHLANTTTSVEYRVCLSRENPDTLLKDEFSGYVQQQLSTLSLSPDQDRVFLCGNPAMIDDTAAFLKEACFGTRQVKREKYVYSGH